MNPISMQSPSAMPSQMRFAARSQAGTPQFSGVFTTEDSRGNAKPRAGRLATAAFAAFTALVGPFAMFDKVAPTEGCLIRNNVTGNVREVEPGLRFRPWLLTKMSACFNMSDPRVTETVRSRSVEGIPIEIPVSIGWKPVKGNLENVYLKVYGRGGTQDPLKPYQDTQGSKEQIEDEQNEGLYENAIYSEARSIIEDVGALIPATQLHTPDAKKTINDALLNGYDPKAIFERFKDFQLKGKTGAGQPPEAVGVLVDGGRRPGLEERITARYGSNVIKITDADAKDTKVLDPDTVKAMETLGRSPILQQQADQQAEINRRDGIANLEKAEADKKVKEKNADADAEVIRKIGEALRQYPESIQQIYAEGFKIAAGTAGNLIITDKDGGNPMIIQPSRPAGK